MVTGLKPGDGSSQEGRREGTTAWHGYIRVRTHCDIYYLVLTYKRKYTEGNVRDVNVT